MGMLAFFTIFRPYMALSEIIKVYIVDDHQIMVDGIRALLKNQPGFIIVGQQTNPVLALQELPGTGADVLITDISMKEMSGIELAARLRDEMPQLRILALSMYGDRDTISEMLETGIMGYVLKNTGMEELVAALTKVAAGEHFFSSDVTAEMMKTFTRARPAEEKEAVTLTSREIEIVKLIAAELNNAQIGDKLFISERTVETHRKNIFRKTAIKSVAGLIKYAMERKLI
jgi:two-component system nitrate/nitrite response regulator NarL